MGRSWGGRRGDWTRVDGTNDKPGVTAGVTAGERLRGVGVAEAEFLIRPDGPWEERARAVSGLMREISRKVDPQEVVAIYAKSVRPMFPADGWMSLSRRGLERPRVRVTRSSIFTEEINPWKQPERLPVLAGGFLSDLIWEEEPRIIEDFCLDPKDPGAAFLSGARSLAAIPHFDGGAAMNMFVQYSTSPNAFDPERFPNVVWLSNLFGRATNNLVLSGRLREAYEALDAELKVVADIQRSLLPRRVPEVPGLELAAWYEASRRAGGDYYDFFELSEGRWGVLMADVSGHGTPAAVLMAILHALAHQIPGEPSPPGKMLEFINRELISRYTAEPVMFVTAFYGVYDSATRTLTYANAGHPAPLWRDGRTGKAAALDSGSAGVPMGVLPDTTYEVQRHTFGAGDTIALYTDGITEAFGPTGDLYHERRLAACIEGCEGGAQACLDAILRDVAGFAAGTPAMDDRTLVVAKVR